jgi:hypothetical protein
MFVNEGGSDIRPVRDVFVLTVATAFMFLMAGYLLTTLITRLFWRGQEWWGYSLAAAGLFIVHFEIMNVGVGGAFDVAERWSIRLFGISAALGCTLGGTTLLSKLERRSHAKEHAARTTAISNAH